MERRETQVELRAPEVISAYRVLAGVATDLEGRIPGR
jgi:hypothetical protein